LFSTEFWSFFGEAAKTSAGFFWKSGWAFVLGYFISAMIQAFLPKGRLTPYLGGSDAKSVALVGGLSWLNHSWHCHNKDEEMEMAGGGKVKMAEWGKNRKGELVILGQAPSEMVAVDLIENKNPVKYYTDTGFQVAKNLPSK